MADTPVTDINKLSKTSQDTIAANAKAQGVTPQEYLTSRGGLYASGYYGDTPEFRRLGDAEYAALASKGGANLINAALTAKKRAAYIADPSLIEDPDLRMSFQNERISIDDVLNAELPGSAPTSKTTFEPIGAMADGTPIYGYGSDGKPVTSPTGSIYSTTSSSDAITKFNSGSAPLSTGSSTTRLKTSEQLAAEATNAANKAARQSAYDLLYEQFNRYGLGSLVAPLKDLITSGASPSEFTIKLRETPAYKQRFAANDMRIANGFAAIDEATYLALEDKYQSIMQNYGLPPQMYAKGELGTQEGFQKLIANNVDPITAEERILEGKKLTASTKQTLDAAKQFYPSLTDGDILAYVLDPKNALSDIKRKVTAAEIGGAQIGAGLAASAANAEALAGAGVTGQRYQQAAPFIAEAAQRGSELASFYGLEPYNQASAEAEALSLAGGAQAAKKRRQITALEGASFSGQSGISQTAMDRNRPGAI